MLAPWVNTIGFFAILSGGNVVSISPENELYTQVMVDVHVRRVACVCIVSSVCVCVCVSAAISWLEPPPPTPSQLA